MGGSMTRNYAKRMQSRALLAGLAITAASAHAEPKTNDGGSAIKKAQGMIRQLSQEKTALEAERAAWQADKSMLEAKLKSLEDSVKRLPSLQAEKDRYKTGLETVRSNLEAQLGQQRQREQALVQKHNDVVLKAKAIQGDNQLLVQAVREREQWITQCEDSNRKLHSANLEIIDQYKDKGLLQQLAELEPLTGIARVETESVAEDYRYKLQQLTITPFQASEPAKVGQALERSEQTAAEKLNNEAGSP